MKVLILDGELAVQFSCEWLEEQIKHFAQITTEILSKKPKQFVTREKFAEEHQKHTGKQLIKAEFGCKKLSTLLDKIKHVAQLEEVEVS